MSDKIEIDVPAMGQMLAIKALLSRPELCIHEDIQKVLYENYMTVIPFGLLVSLQSFTNLYENVELCDLISKDEILGMLLSPRGIVKLPDLETSLTNAKTLANKISSIAQDKKLPIMQFLLVADIIKLLDLWNGVTVEELRNDVERVQDLVEESLFIFEYFEHSCCLAGNAELYFDVFGCKITK